MNVLVFDIETIPDIQAGRRLYDFEGLSDTEAADALFQMRREETNGSDFLRLHFQRIAAISILHRQGDELKVCSLGDLDADEADIVSRFFKGIARYEPTLVSWNGSGFDLPVLHYRALFHGIAAPNYWETGEHNQAYRWNNYLNRYHERHCDVMDVIAGYQARANAPLDQIATILGFPGKMGMSGAKVWTAYCDGELKAIRDYCETDVLNTYLVYLRFELMRGHLTPTQLDNEYALIKRFLAKSDEAHFQQFLETWEASQPYETVST